VESNGTEHPYEAYTLPTYDEIMMVNIAPLSSVRSSFANLKKQLGTSPALRFFLMQGSHPLEWLQGLSLQFML